jgi:hypothetical protein
MDTANSPVNNEWIVWSVSIRALLQGFEIGQRKVLVGVIAQKYVRSILEDASRMP